MSENKIVILGAGAAGLGAAHRLDDEGIRATIYEKHGFTGGHAASFEQNGFIFDDGPHISFTEDERIRKLFHESVGFEVESFSAQANNYWQGHYIKHPAQVNLHGLPEDFVVKIIKEMFEVKVQEKPEINNYRDWLYASFGKTFSETFPMMYGKKFHTLHASLMDTDWIGPRLYQADMDEVLHGALSKHTPDVHYIKQFYYPTHGGFVRFFDGFLDKADVQLSHEVTRIETKEKMLQFASGQVAGYDNLISSLPLPELIALMDDVPDHVREASLQLACSTCVIVNVGVDRENLSEAHWTYFYDEDIIFTRISYPHMQSPNNVPSGCGSVQMEIYFSKKYKPLTNKPESYIQPAIDDLIKCKILNEEDKILFSEARVAPYANVIFDLDRIRCLEIVHGYLDELGIRYCGRFGEWGYHWTDGSFISGENAAQKILDL
ncbi:FAD-dependent oxidoreductase [Pontiellaceae bacterium B12227]|nr:FAD-dependent oxidoreductase [Pontiellaceae bacterium B12227]